MLQAARAVPVHAFEIIPSGCAGGRGFGHLDSIVRHRLLDGLCSNLSVLCLSAAALAGAGDGADEAGEREASAAAHRAALHAYVFFLSWLCGAAEAEARAVAPAAPTGAPLVVSHETPRRHSGSKYSAPPAQFLQRVRRV